MPSTKSSKNTEEKQGFLQNVGKTKLVTGTVGLLVFVAFVWLAIGYIQAQSKLKELSDPSKVQELANQEAQVLIANVKKHILVPENEDPVIATIQDVETLKKEQSFYKNARNGHKVIIYSEKAIIYDPEQDVLVNVGPVIRPEDNQQKQQPTESENKEDSETQEQTGPMSLDIRNGSKTIGVAQELSTELDEELYTVSKIANAANRDYEGNSIINLGGRDIQGLKAQLNATELEALPEQEEQSEADVVVILGNE